MPERLIDANALKLNLPVAYGSVTDAIDNTPTVDAVRVVHGKWIICSDGYYPYCSICHNEPKSGKMTKYCPSCGAKMDEEESE